MITIWLVCFLIALKNATAVIPVFPSSTFMRSVLVPADTAIGSVIHRLVAYDKDNDYPIIFKLFGNVSSPMVQIDSLPCTKQDIRCMANVVLRRHLEAGQHYEFKVLMTDTQGEITHQNCSFTATNSTTPFDQIFPKRSSIITVLEDAMPGTELDHITARVKIHKSRYVWKGLSYMELWGSSLFAIHEKTIMPEIIEGTIVLARPLDFEKQSIYHLTLILHNPYIEPGAQDTRSVMSIDIVVFVNNVEDVAPIFTMAPPVTRLPSGLMPGDKILQVHAEDGDKGASREIRYGLVPEGNPFTSFFDINDMTGEITLLYPLDTISAITYIGEPVMLTVIAEEMKVEYYEPPAMATTVQLALYLPERSNLSHDYGDVHHATPQINDAALVDTTETLQQLPHTDESHVYFWLIIAFSLFLFLGIFALLFCCTCSCCPLYIPSRKGSELNC